jgi:hypothetical protein
VLVCSGAVTILDSKGGFVRWITDVSTGRFCQSSEITEACHNPRVAAHLSSRILTN